MTYWLMLIVGVRVNGTVFDLYQMSEHAVQARAAALAHHVVRCCYRFLLRAAMGLLRWHGA